MLGKIFPFIIFDIWNFNRMNVKLTCVNDWISNCKYFSNKAKCSNCDPINLLKTIFWIAVFIKTFNVNAYVSPNPCLKNLTWDVRKCFTFLNLFRSSSKEDSSPLIFVSLDYKFNIDQLSNRNEHLKHYHRKGN